MVKRIGNILVLCLVALIATSCQRRDLVDPGNTHYVRVYIDDRIKNVTTGFHNEEHLRPDFAYPEILRIMLCDRTTGRPVAERYLRTRKQDGRGIYYEGYVICDAGDYDVMAYNFGTESTVIRNEHSFTEIEAYTNEVAPNILSRLQSRTRDGEERIVYIPDHLFVAESEGVHIAPSHDIDTLRSASGDHFTASSVVRSYYLQIGLRGAQYVSSIVGLLTGMVGSTQMHGAVQNTDDPVTLYFEMTHTNPEEGDALLYTTFHTFGKLPDQTSNLTVTFDIITTDGRGHTVDLDITLEFDEPEAVEHQWLLIDKVIEVPKPEEEGGGGFNPGVGNWEDVNTVIPI